LDFSFDVRKVFFEVLFVSNSFIQSRFGKGRIQNVKYWRFFLEKKSKKFFDVLGHEFFSTSLLFKYYFPIPLKLLFASLVEIRGLSKKSQFYG